MHPTQGSHSGGVHTNSSGQHSVGVHSTQWSHNGGVHTNSSGQHSVGVHSTQGSHNGAPHTRTYYSYTGPRNGFNQDSYNALRQRLAGADGTHSLPESTWRQYRERNRQFPCPTCREKISLPSAGINGFRHDFRVSQLQEWMKGFKEKQEVLKV